MLQAFKIIREFDKVDSTTCFQRVDVSIRTTRSAEDPLNLKPQAARLETRRNFFSNRVVEAWNIVPGEIKREKTVSSFKNAYRRHFFYGGERLGPQREGKRPVAGPHPDPDTSCETLPGSLDINKQETRMRRPRTCLRKLTEHTERTW